MKKLGFSLISMLILSSSVSAFDYNGIYCEDIVKAKAYYKIKSQGKYAVVPDDLKESYKLFKDGTINDIPSACYGGRGSSYYVNLGYYGEIYKGIYYKTLREIDTY